MLAGESVGAASATQLTLSPELTSRTNIQKGYTRLRPILTETDTFRPTLTFETHRAKERELRQHKTDDGARTAVRLECESTTSDARGVGLFQSVM